MHGDRQVFCSWQGAADPHSTSQITGIRPQLLGRWHQQARPNPFTLFGSMPGCEDEHAECGIAALGSNLPGSCCQRHLFPIWHVLGLRHEPRAHEKLCQVARGYVCLEGIHRRRRAATVELQDYQACQGHAKQLQRGCNPSGGWCRRTLAQLRHDPGAGIQVHGPEDTNQAGVFPHVQRALPRRGAHYRVFSLRRRGGHHGEGDG
mmetsp:Transcript_35539/g.82989  ORF Transcript_35539/g.82989 Transcript_35539/m.82989 type:complete len:205 (-) Transcript_35539:1497-2111(-)